MLFRSYVTADEIHDDHGAVATAQKGTRVSIKVTGKIRPSDKLFKIVKDMDTENQ